MEKPTITSIANFLARQRDQLLADWRALAFEASETATETKSAALINLLPEALDELVKTLSAEAPLKLIRDESLKVGGIPFDQRIQRNKYALEQVFWEYAVLQRGLFTLLERNLPLSLEAEAVVGQALLFAFHQAASRVPEASSERPPESSHVLPNKLPETSPSKGEAGRLAKSDPAQQLLKSLLEGEQDYAIFALDPKGYITTWNQGAVRMKQYTPAEAIGSHYSMLYPEEARLLDQPMEHLRMAARDGRYRGEGVRVRKSGEHFIADVLITPMYKDGELIGFSKVVADVTEQGLLERERDESRQLVKSLKIEKGLRERFVATLSHDLRNPLTAARSGLEMISQFECGYKSHTRLAQLALQSIIRADHMITDLLDVSSIRAGEPMPVKLANCDLRKLLLECDRELTAVHGDRFEFDVGIHPVIGHWDCTAFMRVIENLANNAVKYGDPSRKIRITLEAVRDRVLIVVQNWGEPIGAEDQRALFEPFQRTQSAREGTKKGWGLGLALVRGIVEAHGGTVSVESRANEGTSFTIDLPRDSRSKAA